MLVALLLAAGAAAATPVDDAKALISAGRLGEARSILDHQAGDAESHFLLGLIAVEEHNYRAAIAQFRRALASDPRSPRLRLELARAFYLAGDFANAELQFERALAGDLPTAVKANARRFLAQLRRDKRWSYGFSFGVAPNTNVNAGSSARETTIFGLPFQLGNDSRMRSGVGAIAGANIEFSPSIGEGLKWKVGISAQRRDYGGTNFGETIVSGWSGPKWFGAKVEVGAAATVVRRWYGGLPYQKAIGGRLEAVYYPDSHTAIPFEVSRQDFDYPSSRSQSGPVWSANAGVIRILDPTTSASLILGSSLQKARVRDLANRSLFATVTLSRDFRGGFTVIATPTYAVADYDAPDTFFGIVRHDHSTELQLKILNRRATLWRFTPTISYTHARRKSTITLYDTRQDRLEFGLTTQF